MESDLEPGTHVDGGFRRKGCFVPVQRCATSDPGLDCQAAASWKVTSLWRPHWAGVFCEILRAEIDYVPGMRGLCYSPHGPLL